MSAFAVSGAGRIPTHCYSFVTWEHAQETEASIQVKQPLRKGKRHRKSCPQPDPLRQQDWSAPGVILLWEHIRKNTWKCALQTRALTCTVHLYYVIYITHWGRRGLKLGLGGPLQSKAPHSSQPAGLVSFSMSELCYERSPLSKYNLLQYNANQHHSECESVYRTCNKYFLENYLQHYIL